MFTGLYADLRSNTNNGAAQTQMCLITAPSPIVTLYAPTLCKCSKQTKNTSIYLIDPFYMLEVPQQRRDTFLVKLVGRLKISNDAFLNGKLTFFHPPR